MSQMDFDFTTGGSTVPDRSLDLIGGTPDDVALALHNAATVKPTAVTNCTLSVCDGVTRRAVFIRETEHGRCQIQFPGETYSTGEPRIQTINRQCVTRDGESR